MRELLFILLVLACPLMMILMMRGHGGHAHGADAGRSHHERERWPESTSTAELRRQRDALDRLIEERETVMSVAGRGFEHDGDRSSSG